MQEAENVLVIGNKTYSSWSLRAWLAVKISLDHNEYEEYKCTIAGANASEERKNKCKETLLRYSPTGKLPALYIKNLNITVYDSFAIGMYLAEKRPESGLLPLEPAARALCISAAAEMHSGFEALRKYCPMNCVLTEGGSYGKEVIKRQDVCKDLLRMGELWTSLRNTYGTQVFPYLFGKFSIADCMYAPIALRLRTYDPTLSTLQDFPIACQYVQTLLDNSFIKEWVSEAEGESEEWKIDSYDNLLLLQ